MATCASKVQAIVRGREVQVWSAEDAVWLREEWRIVGSLVGALGSHPRQNAQLGLPLILSPDEATLLRDHGVVELCSYLPPALTDDDGKKFSLLREIDFGNQVAGYRERQERSRREHGQWKEGEAPSKRPRLDPTVSEEGVGGGSSDDVTIDVSSFSPLVCIHTVDPAPVHCRPLTPEQWIYPHTPAEVLRYRVFTDLWSRGKYVTSGAKYGGDLLVYSGDPCLVHSDYVAVLLPWQQPITNMVSLGHLGSKVKKNVLFCSVSPTSQEVTYFTLQWSRM